MKRGILIKKYISEILKNGYKLTEEERKYIVGFVNLYHIGSLSEDFKNCYDNINKLDILLSIRRAADRVRKGKDASRYMLWVNDMQDVFEFLSTSKKLRFDELCCRCGEDYTICCCPIRGRVKGSSRYSSYDYMEFSTDEDSVIRYIDAKNSLKTKFDTSPYGGATPTTGEYVTLAIRKHKLEGALGRVAKQRYDGKYLVRFKTPKGPFIEGWFASAELLKFVLLDVTDEMFDFLNTEEREDI